MNPYMKPQVNIMWSTLSAGILSIHWRGNLETKQCNKEKTNYENESLQLYLLTSAAAPLSPLTLVLLTFFQVIFVSVVSAIQLRSLKPTSQNLVRC